MSEIYTPENTPLFEAIYGEGLISLGGYGAVDEMFRGIPLTHKHLLDIGCGIGGIPKYLAKKYDCHVTGLEIHPWMACYGEEQLQGSIKERVDYMTYKPGGPLPLPSHSMDLVYSKGVLTNVADKPSLFKDVRRVLKPGGSLCLIDWLVPDSQAPSHQQLPTGEASYKESPSTYRKILEEQGFMEVTFEDVSAEYLEYVTQLQDRLSSEAHKETYKEILGDKLRDILLKSNMELMHAIQSGTQHSMRILACV